MNGRNTGPMRPYREPRQPLRGWWAAGICVAGGLLLVLSFPRPGQWWLAPLGVAALSIATCGQTKKRAAWLGFVFGAAFFLPLLHWTSTFVGAGPWLILALAEAGYFAALGPLLSVAGRLRATPVWVACLWVAEEAIRDRAPFGGFPWGRLAFSQSESPLRWFAALGGAPLLTAVVALAGGLLAAAVPTARPAINDSAATSPAATDTAATSSAAPASVPTGRGLVRPLGALGGAVAVFLAGLVLSVPLNPHLSDQRTLQVALIQGSVPDRGLEFNERRRQVLDNHVNETLALAAEVKAGTKPQPDIVMWPENASDIDPLVNEDARAAIEQAVQAIGVPILVGAILDGPGEGKIRNAGILWSPTTGPGQMYVKRHPVPFGEYIPLRSLARMFSKKVDLVANDMIAGGGDGRIDGGPVPIGDIICFEVAYDAMVRSSVAAGAQLLVVQTNNATFGHSAETYQQLAMSKLRAVEHGRTVLQVATSGKSAIITADGSVQAESGALFTPAILDGAVPVTRSITLATRLGELPEWVLTAAGVLAAAFVLIDDRLRRRRANVGTADETAPDDPARKEVTA